MPHISRINTNLHLEGAHISITVYPPQSVYDGHKAKGTICPAVSITHCLIDTGATNSCIDQSIATKLGLIVRDKQMVGNANGQAEQFLYDVGFHLLIPNIPIIALQVFGADLSKQPYKALLGRDVLRFCNFTYSGANNFWTLSI